MMDLVIWIGGAIALLLALLVARGAYLLGRGTDAEYDARDKLSGSATATTGFTLLDVLRFGKLPIVSKIEERVGRKTTSGDRARCRDCRHVWLSGQPTSQPVCPSCGGKNTRLVAVETGGA
jgi:rRNA maturation endonuclease Nob1